MTETTPPKAQAGPPPSADAQDPLPESNFLWRRIFAFASISGLLLLVGYHLGTLGEVALENRSETAIEGLIGLLRIDLYLIGLIATYYLLAPSAEQMVKIIQTARALREGVVFSGVTRAASPTGATAEAETTAGKPAEPLVKPDAAADEVDAAPTKRPEQ